MADQILSIVEYARAFQLSDMTVRRRIKTGRLQAFLQDGKYYIPVPAGYASVPAEAQHEAYYNEPAPTHAPQPPRRPQPEMQVIKAHPAAQKTYQQPVPPVHQPTPQHRSAVQPPPPQRPMAAQVTQAQTPHAHVPLDAASATIPTTLTRHLAGSETSLVDTRALLAFCEASLKKFHEAERRQVEKFKARLEALEATLAQRDQEVQGLRQQVEDLQLLVKVLERKKTA